MLVLSNTLIDRLHESVGDPAIGDILHDQAHGEFGREACQERYTQKSRPRRNGLYVGLAVALMLCQDWTILT